MPPPASVPPRGRVSSRTRRDEAQPGRLRSPFPSPPPPPPPPCGRTPPRYGERRYWDERYREGAAEPREWLGGFGRFSELLEAELRHGDSVLVLGCGTSALSYELHERGYQDVTSIDFSPACIEAMRARYARCPRLRWAVMDMRALAFPDASFDVVLEKGTLDVLLVDEKDPWRVSPRAAAAMHRVLAEVRRHGAGGCLGWWGVGGHTGEMPVPSPLLVLFACCDAPHRGQDASPRVDTRGGRGGDPASPGDGDILWPPHLRSR
ncbi:EEF1A lysine methyltransferase 4 [Oxyura jamaicensis]|uniref:EEF1A lysine methyltransferase 4 n=1 Tax=Oxyura jamaicensis TaxID=8884 RepID=UPI0015A6E754|nr:EEF1A lysine methyltransferase 4 [Oxyura jamaicensis]